MFNIRIIRAGSDIRVQYSKMIEQYVLHGTETDQFELLYLLPAYYDKICIRQQFFLLAEVLKLRLLSFYPF